MVSDSTLSDSKQRQQLIADLNRQLPLPKGMKLRTFQDADFSQISAMSDDENWATAARQPRALLLAWRSSWPSLILTGEDGRIIGFLRGLTDGHVTTYVCELLVRPGFRGQGLGSLLLMACHMLAPEGRIDLLANASSQAFYRLTGFRAFYGFRRSAAEAKRVRR